MNTCVGVPFFSDPPRFRGSGHLVKIYLSTTQPDRISIVKRTAVFRLAAPLLAHQIAGAVAAVDAAAGHRLAEDVEPRLEGVRPEKQL